MEGLILAIDFSDDYCKVSGIQKGNSEPEDMLFQSGKKDTVSDTKTKKPQNSAFEIKKSVILTAIGKKTEGDGWLIGLEAYNAALEGKAKMEDKLLSHLSSKDMISIGQSVYTPQELMTEYLRLLLEKAYREFGEQKVERLIITMKTIEIGVMDAFIQCTDKLGFARNQVFIMSHIDAFCYYVLSQKKEYWSNESVLFDWSENQFSCYRLRVQRGVKPQIVHAEHELLDSDISDRGVAEDEAKQKVADERFARYAGRVLDKKIVSSVWLSGIGLNNCQNWVKKSFINAICNRRRVFSEPNIFAKGAAYFGLDSCRDTTRFPYIFESEGRLLASIMVKAADRGIERYICLAEYGSRWYDIHNSIDLIVDSTEYLEIKVIMSGGKLVRTFHIPLDDFPKRPKKTTRIKVILSFVSEKEAILSVIDEGFGELFPASGIVKKSKIEIA